mmetsp:Transcript_22241/g.33090  ORF Transcript_22241/g.33090 Transcript_22241/m.33090 type:complete len:270 (-) Transcript_22241:1082-1891(-)
MSAATKLFHHFVQFDSLQTDTRLGPTNHNHGRLRLLRNNTRLFLFLLSCLGIFRKRDEFFKINPSISIGINRSQNTVDRTLSYKDAGCNERSSNFIPFQISRSIDIPSIKGTTQSFPLQRFISTLPCFGVHNVGNLRGSRREGTVRREQFGFASLKERSLCCCRLSAASCWIVCIRFLLLFALLSFVPSRGIVHHAQYKDIGRTQIQGILRDGSQSINETIGTEQDGGYRYTMNDGRIHVDQCLCQDTLLFCTERPLGVLRNGGLAGTL